MKAQKYTKETIRDIGIQDRQFPAFEVGDAINVARRVSEGGKERVQNFEGDVIAIRRNGISSTFTIRKIGANNVPVEMVLPLYSPVIESITLIRKGEVRRAKLYYMRGRIGKAARVKEKVITKEQKDNHEVTASISE
jgi:large subunit ribosomal protein L19